MLSTALLPSPVFHNANAVQDCVSLVDNNGEEFARGLVSLPSVDLAALVQQQQDQQLLPAGGSASSNGSGNTRGGGPHPPGYVAARLGERTSSGGEGANGLLPAGGSGELRANGNGNGELRANSNGELRANGNGNAHSAGAAAANGNGVHVIRRYSSTGAGSGGAVAQQQQQSVPCGGDEAYGCYDIGLEVVVHRYVVRPNRPNPREISRSVDG